MARYSIDGQILTDIGDAIRSKVGETEYRDIPYESKDYRLDRTHFYYDQYLSIPVDGAVSMQVTPISYVSYSGDFQIYAVNCTIPETITAYGTEPFMMTNFTSSDHVGLHHLISGDSGLKYNFSVIRYDADGNVIPFVANEEVPKTMTPERMADEINNMPTPPTVDELKLTGNFAYRFYGNGWQWFIEKYGSQITTENITGLDYAFQSCNSEIPFDLNCCDSPTNAPSAFSYYQYSTVPMIHKLVPSGMKGMFQGSAIVRFPEGFGEDWDWSYMQSLTDQYSGDKSGIFNNCFKLRELPMILLQYGNPYIRYSYHQYQNMCTNCYVLDEIVGLPNPHNAGTYYETSTSRNIFNNMLNNCTRLKEFTFAEMDGANWALQILDLSAYVGWDSGMGYPATSGGLSQSFKVRDDASYQALKDNPNWWTSSFSFSRYNHDSAVNTINSLPDCSAYQASSGKGANTIKFKGGAGSATDGGAINTLTEEEIAVAAAKGWTVAFA